MLLPDLPAWNGPVDVAYDAEFSGDPYDPAQNDCRFAFLPDVGNVPEERMAWYDGDGHWRATFVTRKAGPYRARFLRNGKPVGEPFVVNVPGPVARPWMTVGEKRLFAGGSPIWPVGFNLGWQSKDLPPMTETIAKMGKAGLDWARIWATHWDGRNPLWTPPRGCSLDPAALDKWGALFDAADAAKVRIQLTFFHHGLVSTTVNPNWAESPWNAKNPGGWLKDPKEWFTDKEAIRRQRLWLRYAVARWGASSALFGWELFNEVEWADLTKADPKAVGKWHDETKAYLRSIDPYARPVFSSSARELNETVFPNMDMLQPHVYAGDLHVGITEAKPPRIGFVGEFGEAGGAGGGSLKSLREGTLASLLGNHAGAAMWWNWDDVEKNGYYDWFAKLSAIVRETGIADRPDAAPLTLDYDRGRGGPLVAAPGRDWAAQPAMPVTADRIPTLAAFLQGSGHAEMGRRIAITVDVPAATTMTVRLGTVAARGATLVAEVNGKKITDRVWPVTEKDRESTETIQLPIPAGRSEVVLRNDGADWVRLVRFDLPGAGALRTVRAVGEKEWAIVVAEGAGEVSIGGLPLTDGARRIRVWPFEGDPVDASALVVKNRVRLTIPKAGAVIWFRP